MSETLLRTKLLVPPRRPNTVPRLQLMERLDQGLAAGHSLVLISAPAGFGKSTLVGEWIVRLQSDPAYPDGNRVAWLSLDDRDTDLERFLAYLVAALEQTRGRDLSAGEEALAMRHASGSPPAEELLTALLNEMTASDSRIILVLDDYHLIDSPLVDEAMTFLLDHAPPQLTIVIATRSDPNLPVARHRARGQLTELRAADLRFAPAEVGAFLNETMGLGLAPADIAALESRTEGWIAGLQLAAISMLGRPDSGAFIRSFAGSHHFVVDYLVEEVLEQQPAHIQRFLLQTAILDRLTGSLCDAVTGQDNGQAILDLLAGANLFLVALDHERQWYRYHQLFSDLLRQRLRQTQAAHVPDLHLSASAWYEQEELWLEAIHHAHAARHLERVADLAELAWRPLNLRYQAVTWLGWVKALPDELIRSRPALSAGCGWASLDAGDLAASELHFQDAERWLGIWDSAPAQPADSPKTALAAELPRSAGMRSRPRAALDEEASRSLAVSIANGRAYLAQARGDVAGTIKYAQRASALLRQDDYFERALSDILAGFAYWSDGDLETAFAAVANAVAKMEKTGRLLFIISFTSYLADILTAQGRLRDAVTTYLRLLQIAAEQGKPEAPELAVAHLGLCELVLEQGDMEVARRHLQTGEAFGDQPWFAPWYRHWIAAHARVMTAQGDLDGVVDMLGGAERLYYRHPIPDVRPLKALQARARLARHELAAARRLLDEQDLSVEDDLSYLRECEHITLARLLIAEYESEQAEPYIQDAMGLLARLLPAAEQGGRVRSVIEILVLQALAFAARGDIRHAFAPLERALALAEPEGFCQLFVDEGPPMAHLLAEMRSQGFGADYVRRLLAAFPVSEPDPVVPPQSERSRPDWIEPLSQRELEVLQLIAAGLTNRQIGRRLYLSLNTVKVHTRNIYGKLGVHSRTQAVARAMELELLVPA